ncbi:MAG: hypothetical protein NTY08_13525 [Proteobacteria bacterium]|nr:hypothetical protein [Pseudomonadota bacterium]
MLSQLKQGMAGHFHPKFLRSCLILRMSAVILFVVSGTASADPLIGDAAAAYSTADAAEANPANAAFLDYTQFSYVAEILKSDSIDIRYPNFTPTTLTYSGVATPLNKPGFIWRANPQISLGAVLVPPLPVAINIKKNRVPVVVVGTQNYVDLTVAAKVRGIGTATFAYRVSDRLGLGIGANLLALSFTAKMVPSSGGTPLADLDGSVRQLAIVLGARFVAIPGILQLGLAATVLSQDSKVLNVSSPFVAGGSASDPAQRDGSKSQAFQTLSSVLLGSQIAISPRIRLLADVRYTRADKSQVSFSLVTLKKGTQDLHDTLSVRTGTLVNMMPNLNLLLGFRYEPSSIGPGSRGDTPLVGFGTVNLVEILAGLAPITPYTMIAAGVQIGLMPSHYNQLSRGGKLDKKSQNSSPYFKLLLESGVAYSYASIGIDKTGELPGTYVYRKIGIPVGIIYRF